MSGFLFVVGRALGHVARTAVVADAIRAVDPGVEIQFFAVDDGWPDRVIGDRFPVTKVPPGDALLREAESDASDQLESTVQSLDPEVVVFDLNPLWVRTARVERPRVFLANWFVTDLEATHTPLDERFEMRGVDWNSSRIARGLPPWSSARDMYSADLVILLDPPGLVPEIRMPGFEVAGPVTWEPEIPLPDGFDDLAPHLLVALGSTGPGRVPPRMIRRLAEVSKATSIVTVGGDATADLEGADVHHFELLPGSRSMRDATAVVSHAGTGTAYQALGAGRPQLLWPANPGHHFLANRLASLGLGWNLRVDDRRAVVDGLADQWADVASRTAQMAEELAEIDGAALAAQALLRFRESI